MRTKDKKAGNGKHDGEPTVGGVLFSLSGMNLFLSLSFCFYSFFLVCRLGSYGIPVDVGTKAAEAIPKLKQEGNNG
jgi:hypothetical protein